MIQHQQSSGNLAADKRAGYARLCAETLDYDVAIDVQKQALELAPYWATGWFCLGGYFEKTNDTASAQNAYAQALCFSPTDYLGAGLKIAYLAQSALNTVPIAYTEALFDGYADRFDGSLVQGLEYAAPERLAALLRENFGDRKFGKAIDLGCGTGLMAMQVRDQIHNLTGVDLSAAMLANADAKRIYDTLIKRDAAEALMQCNNLDLVMAADVFIYMASLELVFKSASSSLVANGLFLFTVERHDGNERWQLLESMRHAHSANYVDHLLQQFNFKIIAKEPGTIRNDGGTPVAGLFYLAQKQFHGGTHAA